MMRCQADVPRRIRPQIEEYYSKKGPVFRDWTLLKYSDLFDKKGPIFRDWTFLRGCDGCLSGNQCDALAAAGFRCALQYGQSAVSGPVQRTVSTLSGAPQVGHLAGSQSVRRSLCCRFSSCCLT